jgi:serine-type D-Ala-D-Ala carboxypeptidase (penicillin-binding protein 5/6)
LLLGSCRDAEREAELVVLQGNAKAAVEKAEAREADAIKDRKLAIELQAKLTQHEAELSEMQAYIAHRQKELDAIELEMKQAKVAYETKLKRGPLPNLDAERIIVLNPDEDEVLYERNADRQGAIASTTKILTAILIIEAGDLDKDVIIEDSDTRCAPVKMGLKKDEHYTRRSLLTALMVKSSNDIAQALARDNAGSIEAFVAKMNKRAKELGCGDCLFINPNGLPPINDQPEPHCTARDLAKLTVHADKLPDLRAMVKLKTYVFKRPNGREETLHNTNRVLSSCDYCDGFKTGFTSAAGYCLVATGERNGRRRIVIVLNGSQGGVWRDAENLLMWALKA